MPFKLGVARYTLCKKNFEQALEMLQDMVIAAVNEAFRTADADAQNNMAKLTGGFGGLGGLF